MPAPLPAADLLAPLDGAAYLLRGLGLITRPGLRRYVLIPLIINTVLFATLIVLVTGWIPDAIAWAEARLPGWLDWLAWLILPLLVASLLLFLVYGFSACANLVAAPFNGLLAEAVEYQLTGHRPGDPSSLGRLLADALPAFANELRKLVYFLLRAIPLGILFLIPGPNAAAPVLWLAFSAWMLALEYTDYPMANHGLDFRAERALLRLQPGRSLGFGGMVLAASLVPVINFLVMPAAVAGATALWVDRLRPAAAGRA